MIFQFNLTACVCSGRWLRLIVPLKKWCWSPGLPPAVSDQAPCRESGGGVSVQWQHDQTKGEKLRPFLRQNRPQSVPKIPLWPASIEKENHKRVQSVQRDTLNHWLWGHAWRLWDGKEDTAFCAVECNADGWGSLLKKYCDSSSNFIQQMLQKLMFRANLVLPGFKTSLAEVLCAWLWNDQWFLQIFDLVVNL